MPMLADLADVVIGVDTHTHTHTAAVLAAATGAVLAHHTVGADADGYQALRELASQYPGRRVWAVEGSGGYGVGLARALHAHNERVVELDRPSDQPAATVPSPTRSTPSAPAATPWPGPAWLRHALLASGRPWPRCSPRAAARLLPRPLPNASCTP